MVNISIDFNCYNNDNNNKTNTMKLVQRWRSNSIKDKSHSDKSWLLFETLFMNLKKLAFLSTCAPGATPFSSGCSSKYAAAIDATCVPWAPMKNIKEIWVDSKEKENLNWCLIKRSLNPS